MTESFPIPDPEALSANDIALAYAAVRARTLALAEPLSAEDMAIQSMPDVSPTKWHLAHTSWFFEAFILKPFLKGYKEFDVDFHYLFNSYYEAEGPRHPRPERGLISRPDVETVIAYRRHVDEAMAGLLAGLDNHTHAARIAELAELGCNHEEQHQELILTDIKHVLSCNPLMPAYRPGERTAADPADLRWVEFDGGLYEIGHHGEGFAYDCEGPVHQRMVQPFRLAHRLVTNGEYLEFIKDGGYERPEFWLSDGWAHIRENAWTRPIYWRKRDGGWWEFTLLGLQSLAPDLPVCHLSYYEADAFARWANARLPREEELEIAGRDNWPDGGRSDGEIGSERLHPGAASVDGLTQLSDEVWQWTASPFTAYPGFKPAPGAVGEYNGKFMCNQFVLKGGSCFTPPGHSRPSYRNFFPAVARWQMTGLRLAKDV